MIKINTTNEGDLHRWYPEKDTINSNGMWIHARHTSPEDNLIVRIRKYQTNLKWGTFSKKIKKEENLAHIWKKCQFHEGQRKTEEPLQTKGDKRNMVTKCTMWCLTEGERITKIFIIGTSDKIGIWGVLYWC